MPQSIRVDFFQVSVTPNETIQSPVDGFRMMMNGACSLQHQNGGFLRELYKLSLRNQQNFCGDFRKFRKDQLPRVGSPGGNADEIPLTDEQGIIEHNCFVFYPTYNVIAIHYNSHANHFGRFAETLSALWGVRVEITPLISADTLRRLQRYGTNLVEIEAKIPRPTNRDLLPSDDNYTQEALSILNRSGGDYMTIKLAIDRRRSGAGYLANEIKNTVAGLRAYDPEILRAKIDEGGIVSPIDLIADRVKVVRRIESSARYVSSETIFQEVDNAYQIAEADINAYFQNTA